MASIDKNTLSFLINLQKNNNREWFTENKTPYLDAHQNMILFADSLLEKLKKHDLIKTESGKKSLFRIYRDIRFSKEKTPYKTHLSGSFTRANKFLRGGYYFHIQPGASFVGGGFWEPDSTDLKRIREEIAANHHELTDITNNDTFINYFGEIKGERLKTMPRGFDKNHPAGNLLQLKQFLLIRNFSDKEVIHEDFDKKVNETFIGMRPFFDYMSDVLTTDSNGISIFED